ncbi:MAG TPA: thioredoxin family protein [Saprospiraceae bacterium]|nr:thioredoxin family protein [Saprospiraceae bacterium]HMQ84743.1 thioredoxin family protein [Saprospiraceae bacterium]
MNRISIFLFVALAAIFTACSQRVSNAETQSSNEATPATQPEAQTVALKSGISVGDKAPDFELKATDGQTYSFASIKDANGNTPKGYIVVFTCNTCPYAVASEQRIIDLHNKYAPKGYPVVAIQPNDPAVQPGDSFEAMKERAKESNFPFVYLFDEGQEVYPQYGATKTPEVYLVEAKTMIVRYHGAIDDSVRDANAVKEKFLENAIEAIEKGQDPQPATTKAVGCGIKTA